MNSKNHHQKKRFGQHWLVNNLILEKIKEVAELEEKDFILEIGPGRGALTSKLLDSKISRLHAIELDKDLIELLNNKFKNDKNFSLQQGDILSTNLDSINKKITKVIANIPYNITGPIGIAENKVRAKIANNLAKNIDSSAGIFDLARIYNDNDYLRKISVEKIWGIGKQTSNWLQSKGIKNAKEFRDMNEDEIIKKLGIIGKRLQMELKGNKCLPIEIIKKPKKEIQVSRSFGKPITKLEDLTQALAIYAIKASEKMRSQSLKSSAITIFVRTSNYSNHPYQKSAYKKLINATDNTSTILKTVLALSKEIYTPEYKLSKAGVLMQDLTNCKYLQQSIINYESQEESKKSIRLMKTIDSLNKKFNNEVITWAITKKPQEWAMNRNSLSSGSTTDIRKIPNIMI